jgi:hypothetical protein
VEHADRANDNEVDCHDKLSRRGMIRIRMPAIREIKGDNEMPATIEVNNGITIG